MSGVQVVAAGNPRKGDMNGAEEEQCIHDIVNWFQRKTKIADVGDKRADVEALEEEVGCELPDTLKELLTKQKGGVWFDEYKTLTAKEIVVLSENLASVDGWKKGFIPFAANVDDQAIICDLNAKEAIFEFNEDGKGDKLAPSISVFLEEYRNKLLSGQCDFIEDVGIIEKSRNFDVHDLLLSQSGVSICFRNLKLVGWHEPQLYRSDSTLDQIMKAIVDSLQRVVAAQRLDARHVVAFSGGVDSSLVAAVVHLTVPKGKAAACLGISPALSQGQREQAIDVANHIGIPLWQTPTSEGEDENYIANEGASCYYCKTNLYTTINAVATFTRQETGEHPVIYNGTNADDQQDPTRLGLVAAREFDVVSPLNILTKQQVRETAKYLGLPNWNAAASPCLRSRLQFGVEATHDHLQRVEAAEQFVRSQIEFPPEANMRVRFLAGNRAAVELDPRELEAAREQRLIIASKLQDLGFAGVQLRPFKTGSLSGYQPSV